MKKGPATLSSLHQRDPTSHLRMEFNTDHHGTTWATSSDLAAALCDPECTRHRADAGAKSGCYETGLMESVDTAGKEAALSFAERVLAAHTVTRASEDMGGTVIESESYDTEQKLQPQASTVVK